jgi:hypothetical protein
MSTKEYVYVAAAQLTDGSETVLDLEERGWADKELLDRTTRWTLIPKEGAKTLDGRPYPLVTVSIPEGARPVFKSRVFTITTPAPFDALPELPDDDRFPVGSKIMLTDGKAYKNVGGTWAETLIPRFRCYAIGYKLGRRTHWVWVLPTGDIEVGDDNYFANLLLRRLKGA